MVTIVWAKGAFASVAWRGDGADVRLFAVVRRVDVRLVEVDLWDRVPIDVARYRFEDDVTADARVHGERFVEKLAQEGMQREAAPGPLELVITPGEGMP